MILSKPIALFTLAYLPIFLFSAIDPTSHAVWIAEILPAILILSALWWISYYHTLSKTAYLLAFIWLALHTIGAKYTFAEVPFDWFNQLVHSSRNQFDRVAHFAIGLYAYPIAEWLLRRQLANRMIATLFALFSVMSVAAGYEIIEWWYAELAGGEEGLAFLGSQGDIWDAQKDMLCDTLGGITALIILNWQCHKNPHRFTQ
ncbi:DUF2238 domain-containing protein [Vibrio sp.]|uniref:DUF2238 domain-containing protein n=1 Tax=Vibrio sp. TaxID=678 RepID=UPI003D0C1671